MDASVLAHRITGSQDHRIIGSQEKARSVRIRARAPDHTASSLGRAKARRARSTETRAWAGDRRASRNVMHEFDEQSVGRSISLWWCHSHQRDGHEAQEFEAL